MSPSTAPVTPIGRADVLATAPAQSAVSWAAVFAGAAGAAALSLILLVLGTGLGLSTVSPWSGRGISGTTFTVTTVVWLTFTQLAASGIGGYLAGRLRTRWTALHSDEVYFRDTAHGFLAWAIASLATAALLGSVVGTVVGGATQASASVASADDRRSAPGTSGYFIDTMFRTANSPSPEAIAPAANAEAGRIFAAGLANGALPDDDRRYLTQVVARRTGLTTAEAERRVSDTFTRVQAAADQARKATAYGSLWLAASLLIGAFVASLSATFGGRRRDL